MKRTVVPKKKWQELTDEELGGKRENSVCVVRYGGFGAALQISSIFPLLKKQGYSVCVNATEGSKEILSHDPNVAELLTQDTGQIPNEELGQYWERITPLFDKFTINIHDSFDKYIWYIIFHINFSIAIIRTNIRRWKSKWT